MDEEKARKTLRDQFVADQKVNGRITFRGFVLGVLLSGLLAFLSVRGEALGKLYTTTRIPLLVFATLFIIVLGINPLLQHDNAHEARVQNDHCWYWY